MAFYHRTIIYTPGQFVFGRDRIFNLKSVEKCQIIAAVNQEQVDIDNVQDNARQVMHDYKIGD